MPQDFDVLRVSDVSIDEPRKLLARYGLQLALQEPGTPITGSFWGDEEAGIVGDTVYVRPDTPLHSLLHETCHIVCMSAARRSRLDRDAGGNDLEEAAVCYLQLVLADDIAGLGRNRLMQDMDAWGYSFRFGNTLDWFQSDADDARDFLRNHGLLGADGRSTYQLRTT